jgi:hypothetical protein
MESRAKLLGHPMDQVWMVRADDTLRDQERA